jgi:hypothetical protein
MHRIRTEAESLAVRMRCYSHRWLLERGLPSGLPDRLLPSADRLYPRIVNAVGVAVHMPRIFREIESEVEASMSEGVAELHADGVDLARRDLVHPVIFEKRERTIRRLLGTSAYRLNRG